MQIRHHFFIDIENEKIFPAEIKIEHNKIISIKETNEVCENYILPGFIDAHIHIESSMLLPSEFAKIAVSHGTIATVSDPHEIANVCGIDGINFMIENGKKVPFHFFFGAPSCVPATGFETSGAEINASDIEALMQRDDIFYLSEMMNYPGVLFEDDEVMKKILSAKKYKKPIDGHAPGLRGEQAKKYFSAGISTDHECFTKEEAEDKLKLGVKILIREGSAAKNFEALISLLEENEDDMMFCSDDKHPDELMLHHINHHVKRGLQKNISIFKVLKAACINPVKHYNLPIGLLNVGDAADFIVVDNIENFDVLETIINGETVFEKGICKINSVEETCINNFNIEEVCVEDFKFKNNNKAQHIIVAEDGQLITSSLIENIKTENDFFVSDIEKDILKIAVINRYHKSNIALAFIKNFGLKKGAIASTVAHDCHNILCVGVDDESMKKCVDKLIDSKGGICVWDCNELFHLPLPIGGLMSSLSAKEVAEKYSVLDKKAKMLGSKLSAPFMTLSFMALLVIPSLKLSDKGLFDGEKFCFVNK
ncbi:MAG: adenine deaminase [Chitinophagaceae bacterium]|nr:adenine deaminase [Chitinophagaceae bacterium]